MAERGAGGRARGVDDPAPGVSDEGIAVDPLLGAALEGLRRAAAEVGVERATAETLQRSLLPTNLPEAPGLRLAATYLPGSSEARVGGDWFDALVLRDGSVALIIGDVVGRGINAAARMAQLQSATRAYALEGLSPALVLERMNAFAHEVSGRPATLLFAVVDLEAETATLASAGHVPPLLIDPAGGCTPAETPPGTPVGAAAFPHYEETVIAFPRGSRLVMFTDGLIERPGENLAVGLERLAHASATLPDDVAEAAHRLVDRLVDQHGAHDDVALLVACHDQVQDRLELTVPADPAALVTVRRGLGRWLRGRGVPETDAYELQVACGEAAANAIAHAYPPGEAYFEVRASEEGDEIVIQVGDRGRWRTTSLAMGGRGLKLMRELTDEMSVQRDTEGTIVTLRRRRRAEAA
ncbi:MAG TPA: SpoIIE family protein phosphatase [Solirubrobacterales bacterium]